MAERIALSGWGRTAPSVATVVEGDAGGVPALLGSVGPRGLIARGLGRSYGDAAQNAGGEVLAPLPSRIHIDDHGVAQVSAGTSLDELIAEALPRGWFVPVTPGTRQVSIGGAIACDVHGKNHHRTGSFADHVVELDLATPDGSIRTVGPDREPEIFWATAGGMGLTGVITRARIRLLPVESAWMTVSTRRLGDIDAVMAEMVRADRSHTYTVCWIDTLAGGRRLGRSVLSMGEHATRRELSGRSARAPYAVPRAAWAGVPPHLPSLVGRPQIRAFNELWFRKAPQRRDGEIQSISAFFHPLDGLRDWNRLYGARGLVQYQFVIPDDASDELPRILELIQRAGFPSFLSVLKRFGEGNRGLLSFPMKGWTLAMDLPADSGASGLFMELDRRVMDAGGRVYLAKDARMAAESSGRMYPRWEEFAAVRSQLDPHGIMQSDLSRRLEI